MFFLHNVADGLNSGSANAGIAPPDNDGVLDSDCDDFGSTASSKLEDEDQQEPSSPRPHEIQPSVVEFAPPAFGLPPVVEATDSKG